MVLALLACAVLLASLGHARRAPPPATATIEDGAHIATLDDVQAPAATALARPAARIEDGARIATLDDVYAHAPAPKSAPKPAPRPAHARSAARAVPVAPAPAAVAEPAAPEVPQVVRYVPPPVVILQPGFEPGAARRSPAPVVTVPQPDGAGQTASN